MELHQLRYLAAVAQHGSFTLAAEACFVSQPSLSQAIAKLERELERPLFERLGRTVRLTDAGRVFLERATAILAEVDGAKRELIEAADSCRGQVSIGAIPTVAPYLLPRVLRAFAEECPRAEITVIEDVTERTVKRCAAGELDVGIVALPVDDSHLRVQPLFEEELLLILPKAHRLTRRRRITLADVRREPFILLGEAHCLGQQIEAFCHRADFTPTVSCRSAQLLTVQELVALGQGVSLVPEMARRIDTSDERVYRSLAAPRPTRTLAAVWNKQRYQGLLVKRFIERLRTLQPSDSAQ